MEPIISVLNLKNGVGVSSLVWNVAHILELDIYEHDKAMHHLFKKEREREKIDGKYIISNSVSVYPINKRKFKSGVYDLGADINYAYVRQIISRSTVVVIPLEVGAETLIKTIATIQYVLEHNEECDIFVVFNKLDNSDTERERKYTAQAISEIKAMSEKLENKIDQRIKFYYIRYAFAMFRNLEKGNFLIDNFIGSKAKKIEVSNFRLLQHLRYFTLNKMNKSELKKDKVKREMEDSDFLAMYKPFYVNFENRYKLSSLFDGKFLDNNRKIVKDMLILTTHIKANYSFIWKEKNV